MIRNSIARAVSSLVTRPVNGAKLSFEIVMKKLFANGEQGFWYDPSDMGTMFQDAAGTVPVTAVGQAVGLVLDKSGRNNHAVQTTSASRPILRQNAVTGAYYLEFDGSDDFLATNKIDFTSTDKVSLFAGVRKLSDAASGVVVELSESIGITGTFSLLAPGSSGAYSYSAAVNKGTLVQTRDGVFAPAPDSSVVTAKISSNMSISTNGVLRSELAVAGSGNFSKHPLYIGRRGGSSLPFNGHIYGLIGIGKLVSDSETTIIEKELAKRTGVTLSV